MIACELLSAGPTGLAAGVLAARVGLGATALSHHAAPMVATGLISAERTWRQVTYRIDRARLAEVGRSLADMAEGRPDHDRDDAGSASLSQL